jgi:hypothetical protein
MTGETPFKRLLLDQVSNTISQSPSTTSLIELLRLTTPSLQTSNANQRKESYAKVRNVSSREKMFRTLQLRIHPDKHPGDESVTALFQEVTLFYQKCVEAMEKEDSGQWSKNVCNIDATKPKTAKAAHGDYENVQYVNENTYNPRIHRNLQTRVPSQTIPSTHQALAVISLLFPPLGALALYHSLKVRPCWKEGYLADARHHSEQAYTYAWWGLFCVGCLILYVWLRDGDLDFDWDKMKRDLPWDCGP